MSSSRNQEPLAIGDLLTRRSGRLSQLHRHAAELARLRQMLQTVLPPPLRDHFMVAAFDRDTLVLVADGATWAARLRYQIPGLRAVAREQCGLATLKSIRIRTSAPLAPPSRAPRRLRLSSGSVDSLRRSAAATTDEELRALLLRLSRYR
jgi:hypothetical protein